MFIKTSKKCFFVEKEKNAIKILKKNIKKLRLKKKLKIFLMMFLN